MKKKILKSIFLFVCLTFCILTNNTKACSIAGTATASGDSLCYEDSVTITLTGYFGTVFQWQSYDGTGWLNETGTGSNTDSYTVLPGGSKQYRAIVTATGCPSDTSNVVSVLVGTIPVPSGVGASRCGYGSVTLTGTSGAGGGDLKWYSALTGGTALATGNSFTTNAGATTTFYLEDNSSSGGGSGSGQASPILITELDFNDNASGGTGDDIEIQNVGPFPVDVTGWQVVAGDVPGNINQYNSIIQVLSGIMQPGDILSFNDVASSGPTSIYWGQNLFWNNAQASWVMILDSNNVIKDLVITDWDAATILTMAPVINGLTIPIGTQWTGAGVISNAGANQGVIRNGNLDNNNDTDFGLTNLTVGTTNPTMSLPFLGLGCSSPRVPVVATVTTSTQVSINASSTGICISGSSTLTAQSTNSSYTYTWSPATGLNTTTGSTVIASPTTPTTYTVVAVDGACGAIDSVFIDVGPLSVAGNALSTADTVCSGDQVVFTLTGNTGNIQWQVNSGGGYTNIIGATNYILQVLPTQSGTYQAVVTSAGCPSDTSNVLSVGVITVIAPTTFNDTLCSPGTANLTASGVGTLNWFDAPVGGNFIYSGTNYSFNAVSPVTFYVETANAGSRDHVGPLNRNFGNISNGNVLGNGLTFDVVKNCKIDSVLLYPSSALAGSVTINLLDNTGAQINTVTYSYPANSFVLRVPLGFGVIPGTGYQLVSGGGTDTYSYNTSGPVYPYTSLSCPVTITGTTTGSNTDYFYFYDWVINDGCSSARTPVSVIFNGTLPQPTITASGSTLTSSVAPNYQWYLNGALIAGATNQSYNTTQPGLYSVAVNDIGAGCLTFSDPFVITGINNLQNINTDVIVFPNPTKGIFNIQFGKSVNGAADISINNTLGQIVFKTTKTNPAGQTIQIDNKLTKGTYVVTVQLSNDLKKIPIVIH